MQFIAEKYYYTFSHTKDAYAIYLSSLVIIGLVKGMLFFFAIATLLFYRRQLYVFLAYRHRKFAEDDNIISFTQQFCPNFKNAYAIDYLESDSFLKQESVREELSEIEYSSLVDKAILTEKVAWLFNCYQQDRMARKYESIAEYTLEPFKSKHQYLSDRNVETTTNIVYRYSLFDLVPLNFEIREELRRFLVQINGEIISFEVSDRGYVTNGRSQPRYFTQYFNVALDVGNKGYIVAICRPPS